MTTFENQSKPDYLKVTWEANPTGARKIVMDLVVELDPTLTGSQAVEQAVKAVEKAMEQEFDRLVRHRLAQIQAEMEGMNGA